MMRFRFVPLICMCVPFFAGCSTDADSSGSMCFCDSKRLEYYEGYGTIKAENAQYQASNDALKKELAEIEQQISDMKAAYINDVKEFVGDSAADMVDAKEKVNAPEIQPFRVKSSIQFVNDGDSGEAITRAVAQQADSLATCLSEHIIDKPNCDKPHNDLNMSLHWRVDKQAAQKITLVKSDDMDFQLRDCVIKRIGTWKMPATPQAISVTADFTFQKLAIQVDFVPAPPKEQAVPADAPQNAAPRQPVAAESDAKERGRRSHRHKGKGGERATDSTIDLPF